MKDFYEDIKNSKACHPLARAAKTDSKYWYDFDGLMRDYKTVLKKSEYESFLKKSQLDQKISLPQYIQFASESCVVDYIIRTYSDDFCYEPKYEGKKNPECSFKYHGRIVNIEVKTPDLSKREEQENEGGIKVRMADRFPSKEDADGVFQFIKNHLLEVTAENVNEINRHDNKLKDYLVSANGKFPKSEESFFNILVISLDKIRDLDEWYRYIFGEKGAFTKNSYIQEEYSNVDAILLTNLQHGHKSDSLFKEENYWDFKYYISLLFLNPLKEPDDRYREYYLNYAISMFGWCTKDFRSFTNEKKELSKARHKACIDNIREEKQREYIKQILLSNEMFENYRIISEWCEKRECLLNERRMIVDTGE